MQVGKNIFQRIFFSEIIFNKYIKLSPKIDGGDWLFFETNNKLYLIKIINSISEIDINSYQNIPKIYNVLFFDKNSKNIYIIENGFLKKISFLKIYACFDDFIESIVDMPLEMSVNALETVFDYARLSYVLKEYCPLKVKIMHLKDKCYILFPESKTADKNGYYSIDRRFIKDGINLFHFVIDNEDNKYEKNNILRTEVKLTKIETKNNRYIINKKEYKKIESN